MSTNEAMQCLYGWKGKTFHGGVVDQFIQSIGVFPVGTLVELNSGEVGIASPRTASGASNPGSCSCSMARKRP